MTGKRYVGCPTWQAPSFADGLAGQAMNIIAGYRRIDNSVVYGTPKLAGWSAEVAYGAGEVPGGLPVNFWTSISAGEASGAAGGADAGAAGEFMAGA